MEGKAPWGSEHGGALAALAQAGLLNLRLIPPALWRDLVIPLPLFSHLQDGKPSFWLINAICGSLEIQGVRYKGGTKVKK